METILSALDSAINETNEQPKSSILEVATFEPVSDDMANYIVTQKMSKEKEDISDYEIRLPERATEGSAGYDFFVPYDVIIRPHQMVIIETFVRCKFINTKLINLDGSPFPYFGWQLKLYPKSGLGLKTGMRLENTVGIIDSDYYYTQEEGLSNEGHIRIAVRTKWQYDLRLHKGQKIAQGIFEPYAIATNERGKTFEKRNGGFGSTGK